MQYPKVNPRTVIIAWRRAVVTMRLTETFSQAWDNVYGQAEDHITMVPSPYWGKWMFAVDTVSLLGTSLALMQQICEHHFVQHFGQETQLRRRRAIHVSWS